MTSPVLALKNMVKFYPGSHGLVNPDRFTWSKILYALAMLNSAGALSVVVYFAKSGSTIPLYVTAPIVSACGYLNYRERKLWLRDPAALWAANATKENL
jgi:hypothetical protein